MHVFRTGICIAMSVSGLGILGCDVLVSGRPREERVYVQQQPVYAEPQPQYVVVQDAPPAMIVETRPAMPGDGYVWIDGSWGWNNQRYVWERGRYERPPQQGAVWIGARYEKDSKGYRYTPGRWNKQSQDTGHDGH